MNSIRKSPYMLVPLLAFGTALCLTVSAKAATSQAAASAAPPDPAAAKAPSASGAANPPTSPNDSVNYYGDKLDWPYVIYARALPDTPDKICIPENTTVIGESSSFDSDTNKNKWLRVRIRGDQTALQTRLTALGTTACPDPLFTNKLYYVSADDAANAARFGVDFGALVIPFKFHLSGKKELSGSASIGPYVGYRFKFDDDFLSGLVFSPIAFAGASPISVPQNVSGKDTTQTLAGLSWGFGVLTTLKNSFQIGVVLGMDHVNSDSKYQYNDRWWLAAEIGYSFAM